MLPASSVRRVFFLVLAMSSMGVMGISHEARAQAVPQSIELPAMLTMDDVHELMETLAASMEAP